MRTTAPKCPMCAGRSKDWSLCRSCCDQVLVDLRELPDLMRDLLDKRVGRTRIPPPADQDIDPQESRVPFSSAATRTADLIVSTVGTWVRALDQDDLIEPGCPPVKVCRCAPPAAACDLPWRFPLRPRMASWCAWLAERIDRIRFHEAAGQIADDLAGCVKRARASVDLPPELVLVTRCEVCEHDIFAEPDAKTVVCRHCRRAGVKPPEIDVEKSRRRLSGRLEHQWATAAQCALVLGAHGLPVRESTIWEWARPDRGGKLKVRGRDKARRALYRVGDVADLVRGAMARGAATATAQGATRRVTSDAASSVDAVPS